MTSSLLSVRGVKTYYGNIAALRGVDVEVGDGEIVALIGANGAGKSTLMMTICGNPRAREGSITFAGHDITGLPTHEIARLRIAQAPEGRRIFVRMTVMENLQMGASSCDPAHFQTDLERVFALFPRLKERIAQRGGTLSGGEQQMLAIGRALMGRPRLLLLDEPSLGLAPLVARQIFSAIRKLNAEEKLTVFLVEQNAFHALKLAHRGYVMVNGLITLTGTGAELLDRPEVKAAYLEGGRQGALTDARSPRPHLRRQFVRRVRAAHPHPRGRRRRAHRTRDRRELAAVVARRSADAAARRGGALPALRAVRRNAVLAHLLCGRYRGMSGGRPDRFPADAGGADGQLLRLDQRARQFVHMAAARNALRQRRNVRIRVTIAGFAG